MSIKEADRLGVMKLMDKKDLTPKKASETLGLSFKQLRRIRKRYLAEGKTGLISRKRRQVSGNKIAEKRRTKTINLLRKKYSDFGTTLASEKLLENHKLEFSRETLRKWMIEFRMVGFNEISVYFDERHIFPTVLAQKPT